MDENENATDQREFAQEEVVSFILNHLTNH
jgi:hypothetical protein